jgi:hypothetical protein
MYRILPSAFSYNPDITVIGIPCQSTGIFEKIPLLGENGEGYHFAYVREMHAAVDYLSGKTDAPPVPLEWGAEMVRLCCLGFQK